MSFEVGDRVIDFHYGKGRVATVFEMPKYPIYVEFENGTTNRYTKDGKNLIDDYSPRLYHVDKPERKPKHQFKPFEKVLCRDSANNRWRPDFYGFPLAVDGVDGTHRCVVSTWIEVIPYEGNEDKVGKVTE